MNDAYYQSHREERLAYAKEYNNRPDIVALKRSRGKEYYQSHKDEFKRRSTDYYNNHRKELIAYAKEYAKRPEAKARAKELRDRPEAKARLNEYLNRPEVNARMRVKRKEYYNRPEVQDRLTSYMREYSKRPEARIRRKQYDYKQTLKEREAREAKRYAVDLVVRQEERQRPLLDRVKPKEKRTRIRCGIRLVFKLPKHSIYYRRRAVLKNVVLNPEFDIPGFEGHHIDHEHILFIPREIHSSVIHDNISNRRHARETMEQINTKAFCWVLGCYPHIYPEPESRQPLPEIDSSYIQNENLRDCPIGTCPTIPEPIENTDEKELVNLLTRD